MMRKYVHLCVFTVCTHVRLVKVVKRECTTKFSFCGSIFKRFLRLGEKRTEKARKDQRKEDKNTVKWVGKVERSEE